MASLMDNLIEVLGKENEEYKKLIALSEEKTPVIIAGDIEKLNSVTEREQAVVNLIQKLEKERMQVMKDICEVTNHSGEELKLPQLIQMMSRQPAEQKKLTALHDELKVTMEHMKRVNERNRELLESSLEMVQFEMNLLQSMKTALETADYNKSAYNTGTIMGSGTKRFDAKQ